MSYPLLILFYCRNFKRQDNIYFYILFTLFTDKTRHCPLLYSVFNLQSLVNVWLERKKTFARSLKKKVCQMSEINICKMFEKVYKMFARRQPCVRDQSWEVSQSLFPSLLKMIGTWFLMASISVWWPDLGNHSNSWLGTLLYLQILSTFPCFVLWTKFLSDIPCTK